MLPPFTLTLLVGKQISVEPPNVAEFVMRVKQTTPIWNNAVRLYYVLSAAEPI
jgi:hypothetical protein